MHGIRHDQARANKGVDLIESPRAPPTHERDESTTGDPLIFHAYTAYWPPPRTPILRRHWIQVTARRSRVQAHKTADAKIMNPVKGF